MVKVDRNGWSKLSGIDGQGGAEYAASSGNVTDEVIMQYSESQDIEKEEDDNFRISS